MVDPQQTEGEGLVIRGLTHEFGSLRVLDIPRWDCPGPGIVGILGPNGSGKSTLLQLLAGLRTPTSGEIRFRGQPPRVAARAPGGAVGFVPDRPPVHDDMSPRSYLLYLGRLREMQETGLPGRVEEVLRDLALEAEADRPMEELSRGYRQRVSLAQGLLGRPGLLLLDEATAGLDPVILEEVRATLTREASSSLILLASHFLQEVAGLCGRVLVLARGCLMEEVRGPCSAEELGARYREALGREPASPDAQALGESRTPLP